MPNRHRSSGLILVIPLFAGACTVGPAFPGSPASSGAAIPSAAPSRAESLSDTASASASPSASPSAAFLAFADLPASSVDGSTTLEVCDPAPGQALPEQIDVLIECWDGTDLGVRAIQTVTSDPIERTYLDLPECSALPCSADSISTGTLTAWTADAAWTTDLDARTETATAPRPAPDATWPAIAAATPSVKRPAFKDAPAEIANRKPLPFCGRSEIGDPSGPMVCFVAAVLAGRPAEVVDVQHGTEGGTSISIVRFAGRGPIVTYRQHVDAQGRTGGWYRQSNQLILGVEPRYWSANPLDAGEKELG